MAIYQNEKQKNIHIYEVSTTLSNEASSKANTNRDSTDTRPKTEPEAAYLMMINQPRASTAQRNSSM